MIEVSGRCDKGSLVDLHILKHEHIHRQAVLLISETPTPSGSEPGCERFKIGRRFSVAKI